MYTRSWGEFKAGMAGGQSGTGESYRWDQTHEGFWATEEEEEEEEEDAIIILQ